MSLQNKNTLRISAFFCSAIISICILTVSVFCGAQAENAKRSTELQKKKTIDGDTERIDYVNENGIITDAIDKHYATIIRIKDGLSITEEYYDSNGNPAKQSAGYYAVLHEYNDLNQEDKTTYLGIDKQPVMTSMGYSAVLHSYNDNNDVVDTYLDKENNPVKSKRNGYGSCKKYDNNHRCYLIIHLDEHGNPMTAGNGYAMARREFYESGISKGMVDKEFYYDENEEPISLSLGEYGIHKEYDEYGRNNLITYLDRNGNITASKKGYATVKKTFYDDDSVKTEMYYDQHGNPFKMPDGQYGLFYQDGKKYNLNKNGGRYFNLKNVLQNSHYAVIILCLLIIVFSFAGGMKLNSVLAVVYSCCILYMTIMRYTGAKTGILLEPFWSYKQFFTNEEIRWEIINNIILFIPLGVILYCIYPKKIIVLIPIVLSLCIEFVQFIAKTGLCEVDDIISNSLGAVIGYWVGGLRKSIRNKRIVSKLTHEKT